MVWINIWQDKYNTKLDYMSQELINRYNEKFNNLFKFLKNHHSMISTLQVRGSIDKIVYVKFDDMNTGIPVNEKLIGISIGAECTDKQIRTLKEYFGDELQ